MGHRAHTVACRRRMYIEMAGDEEDRKWLQRTKARHERFLEARDEKDKTSEVQQRDAADTEVEEEDADNLAHEEEEAAGKGSGRSAG